MIFSCFVIATELWTAGCVRIVNSRRKTQMLSCTASAGRRMMNRSSTSAVIAVRVGSTEGVWASSRVRPMKLTCTYVRNAK